MPRPFTALLIAAAAVVALTALPRSPETAEPQSASVAAVAGGDAFKSKQRSFAQKTKLTVGSEVAEGEYIQTGPGAKLELALRDGSKLRVAENSTLRVNSLLFQSGSRRRQFDMKVETGRVWASVNKAIGGESTFDIRTPSAVAGVRGTVFRVDLDEEATVIKVYAGAVAVRNIPVYANQEAVDAARNGAAPAGRPRRQVQGPRQVNAQQWEEIIAKELTGVRVERSGQMKKVALEMNDELQNAWVAWNVERDKAQGLEAPANPAPSPLPWQ